MSNEPKRTAVELAAFVDLFQQDKGRPPTVREMSQALDLSLSPTHKLYRQCIAEGLIVPPDPNAVAKARQYAVNLMRVHPRRIDQF